MSSTPCCAACRPPAVAPPGPGCPPGPQEDQAHPDPLHPTLSLPCREPRGNDCRGRVLRAARACPHGPVTASDSKRASVVAGAVAVQAGPEGVSEPVSTPVACSVSPRLPAAPPVYPKVPHTHGC